MTKTLSRISSVALLAEVAAETWKAFPNDGEHFSSSIPGPPGP